jgi:hypothetical protein
MPSAADVALCNQCHAPIRWTVTATGKRLPVNAEPDPAGNAAVHTDAVGRVRSRALTADRPTLEGSEWPAMPHAATCAQPRPRLPRQTPRPVRRPGAWRYR